MGRRNRNPAGGFVYHILNRANHRETLFDYDHDFEALLGVVRETLLIHPMRIIEFCVMPNHWHFEMWPEADGQLADFMHHFTTTHAARWNRWRNQTGHVYQGPYKFFPVEENEHYYTLGRYIVRNALRANFVERAEDWKWSSLHARLFDTPWKSLLAEGPLPSPANWLEIVNRPQTEEEVRALRRHIAHGTPFGSDAWAQRVAKELGIEESLRCPGRPPSR